MIVVSDTTPIITLLKIGRLDLLQYLIDLTKSFGNVGQNVTARATPKTSPPVAYSLQSEIFSRHALTPPKLLYKFSSEQKNTNQTVAFSSL